MCETSDMSSEVQELTWVLVDEQATEGQVRHLEDLVLEDQEARRVYVTCMQIHTELHYMFSGKMPGLPPALEKAIKAPKKSAPLPIVDLPAAAASAHHSSGV
jgi:hypothetical protein